MPCYGARVSSPVDTRCDPLELRRALGQVLHGLLGRESAPVRVGRYRLREQLGRGGAGVVWLADDERIGRSVAIKRLAATEPQARDRLVQEARTLARFCHPNIVQIYEVVHDEGASFAVMEWVEGVSLRQWQAEHPSWRERLAVYREAGRGLAVAHAHAVIHRDFKPDNVVVTAGGDAKVVDFGLALRSGTRASGSVIEGTPGYVAPELRAEAPADARADQYAFCVALRDALLGRGAPASIMAAIERGLAPDPDDRWPDMTALLDRLTLRSRRWWRWTGAAAVAAVAVAIAWFAAPDDRDGACERSIEQLRAQWTPAAKRRIEQALVRVQSRPGAASWPRLREVLDIRVSDWIAHRAPQCAAPITARTTAVAQARASCLQRQHRQLIELLGLLHAPDEELAAGALSAALALSPARSCDDPLGEPGAPPAPEPPAALVSIELRVRAGKLTAARERVDALEAEARGADDARTLAYALHSKGVVLERLGETDAAEQALQEGYWLAAERGFDEVAAGCAIALIRIEGRMRGDIEAAQRWGQHAQAVLDRRVPRGARLARLEIRRLSNLGAALEGASRFEESLSHYERALGQLRRVRQEDRTDFEAQQAEVALLANMAVVYGHLAQHERAERLLLDALASERALLGRHHPDTISTLVMLSTVALRREDTKTARPWLEQALALAERTLPAHHHITGRTLINLGIVSALEGDARQARAHYERAAAILRVALGPEHPQVGAIEGNLGTLALDHGELERARRHTQRAYEIVRAAYGDEHHEVAEAHNDLALIDREQGRCEDARRRIAQAVAVAEATYGVEHPRTAGIRENAVDIERACRAEQPGAG